MLYKEYLEQFIGKGCNFKQTGGFPMLDVGADPQYNNESYILSKVHEDFVILESNPNRAEGTEVLPTIAFPLSSIKISIQGH